jgi:hypothetical protein
MIYQQIQDAKHNGKRMLAVLIDPDKVNELHLDKICHNCNEAGVDFFFVGGSLLTNGDLASTVLGIKNRSTIPALPITRFCAGVKSGRPGDGMAYLLRFAISRAASKRTIFRSPKVLSAIAERISTAH